MKVINTEDSVVLVLTEGSSIGWILISFATDEWVVDQSVSSLEPDLGLEGVLTNRTHHLEWNVWAVE